MLGPVRRGAMGRDDEQDDGAVVVRLGPVSDITINDDAIAFRPTQPTDNIVHRCLKPIVGLTDPIRNLYSPNIER